jgi:hypothetical protein
MEDVLEVYTRPYDPKRPPVCLDEASKQLLRDVRPPLPARPSRDGHPGSVARTDHEYARNGTAALFMVCEPLAGRRYVRVRARRTAVDWAHVVKELVDELYPNAETIVLVMDQLNTHSVASLYEAFPPAEARRLATRLEIHHTPKHGSWLNIAELELSALARQCLDDRMADQPTLTTATAAWERRRNARRCAVDWRFTTKDARIKLKHLYPALSD